MSLCAVFVVHFMSSLSLSLFLVFSVCLSLSHLPLCSSLSQCPIVSKNTEWQGHQRPNTPLLNACLCPSPLGLQSPPPIGLSSILFFCILHPFGYIFQIVLNYQNTQRVFSDSFCIFFVHVSCYVFVYMYICI